MVVIWHYFVSHGGAHCVDRFWSHSASNARAESVLDFGAIALVTVGCAACGVLEPRYGQQKNV